MSTTVMLMAAPIKPTNYAHKFNMSSKHYANNPCSSIPAAAARLRLRCLSQELTDHVPTRGRRTGNYSPSLWETDYIQSLQTDYKEEKHVRRICGLIKQVKTLLEKEKCLVPQLELIDDLQRLGLSDHFQNEIKQMLTSIHLHYTNNQTTQEDDLYSTALTFRLLRQHGFQVSQEVFDCFTNEKGEFMPSLSSDTRGILQLYEASFLLTRGEHTLEIAKEFATNILLKFLNEGHHEIDGNILFLVRNCLDIPIHWRIQRPNISWCIDAYEQRLDMNPVVLELAKLDFNVVQAQYQEELRECLRWWKNTCLVEKLPFVRDRVVESYFWTIGIIGPCQYRKGRIMVTKVIALSTVMDDIYDVYGTLEELELFTEAIQRWDFSSIDQLPYYMQLCYLAIVNFVDDTSYDVLKEKGFNIIPYLQKSWRDLAEAYMVEAKWYNSGSKPKLEEYVNNAWVSIAGPAILSHAFLGVADADLVSKDSVDDFYNNNNILRSSSIILRLADDLATSQNEMERGDVPKSIQCYMNDNNASEEEAREHVRRMIAETWKKMNEERVSCVYSTLMECAVGMARMGQYMYHYGDGHGIQPPQTHLQMSKLLFHPLT